MISVVTDPIPLLQGMGTALGIGLLIGLERGWHERAAADGARVAGVRTFGLFGVMGGVCALLADHFGAFVLSGGLLAVAAIMTAGYWLSAQRDATVGITTEVAGLLAFILGAAAMAGYPYVAVTTAVVATILLGTKSLLHTGVSRLSQEELYAVFKLLLVALVLLPILPDGDYGPWGALNPYVLGWLILLLTGLSFVGYFAIRILGPSRGLLLTSVFGGLVSSTALTLNFSRIAKGRPALTRLLAMGIVIASATLFPRVLIEVGIINPSLLGELVPILGAMMLVAYVGVLGVWWRHRSPGPPEIGHQVGFDNPFELGTALRFGALLAVIMLLARGLEQVWGDSGVYALAAISGLADVDALVLSLARMAEQQHLSATVASHGMVIAIFVNSLVKNALAFALGGVQLGRQVALILMPTLAVGILILILGGH